MPAQILGILLLFLAIFILGLFFSIRKNRRIKKQGKPPAHQSRIVISQRVPTVSEILRKETRTKEKK